MATQRGIVAPSMDTVGELMRTVVLDVRAVLVSVELKVLFTRILPWGNFLWKKNYTFEGFVLLVKRSI